MKRVKARLALLPTVEPVADLGLIICKGRQFAWRQSIPDAHSGFDNDHMSVTDEHTGKETGFSSASFCSEHHFSMCPKSHSPANWPTAILALGECHASLVMVELPLSANHILPSIMKPLHQLPPETATRMQVLLISPAEARPADGVASRWLRPKDLRALEAC